MATHTDQTTDQGLQTFVRLTRVFPLPDFVKAAAPDRLTDPSHRPASVYADPIRQLYPCDTKDRTYVSAMYYFDKRADYHVKDRTQIERRLDSFAQYWGIKAAYDGLVQAYETNHKTAEAQLSDDLFAYVWRGENGRTERHLPLRSPVEVKEAADYLVQYRDRFTFTDRHAMATKILIKAAQYGARIGEHVEFLERQAGRGVCDPAKVVAAIQTRAALTTRPDLKAQLTKMAATVKTLPSKATQPGTLIKLAETLDIIDREHRWTDRYAADLRRPEDVCFECTFTKTSTELHAKVQTASGKVYEKSALGKLALSDLRDLFGDDFADRVRGGLAEVDVEKLAEEAATLPRPDAALLEGLLADSGITPVMRGKAAAPQGVTREAMNAWAKALLTAP